MFDRHARFGANQQQVEGVGERPLELLLALDRLVAEEELGRLDAEVTGGDRDADLDRDRLIPLEDREQIDRRDKKERDRSRQAKRQERVFGSRARKPAIANCILAFSVESQLVRLRVSASCLTRPLGLTLSVVLL
jgi:hypothetical protein